VAKTAGLEEKQREQIVRDLREKKELSMRGIFRPMFLTGDISVENPAIQAADANLVATRRLLREEVAIAFGIPPSMFEQKASYSEGAASDRFILIEETCMPLSVKIAGGVERLLNQTPGFLGSSSRIFAWFSWDDHSVMQTVRRNRIDSLGKLFGVGMPVAKASDYLDLALPRFSGDNISYLPFSIAPAGSELNEAPKDPAEDESLAEGGGEKSGDLVDGLKNLFSQRRSAATAPVCMKARDEKRINRWKSYMTARRPVIKDLMSRFNRVLMIARADTLRRLEAAKTVPSGKAAAADLIFNLPEFQQRLWSAMRGGLTDALQTAGTQFNEEIGKDDPFRQPPQEVQQFLANRENRISGASKEVFDRIKAELQEGIDAGESMAKLTDRVKGAFNDVSRSQAQRIASTETSAAYGTARQSAMRQAGIQKREWLTSGNDNVREAHKIAEGQQVGIDEPFSVGGEHLLYPGDPSGSPDNVINCHCVAVAVRTGNNEEEES
jgi:SPP1 gp7 family putative phage head morphogenesis protein